MKPHASSQPLLPLEPLPADDRTFLNASVWFVDSDDYRVVFHRHEPLYRVALTDEVHLRLVAVALHQSELATQEAISTAFGHDLSTQARWERAYRKHGLDGLTPRKRSGRPRGLDKSQEAFVRRWFHAEVSNRQMAKRLGVGESTIRRSLRRLRLMRETPASPPLPAMEDTGPVAVVESEASPENAAVEENAAVAEGVAASVSTPTVRKTTLE
jgi:transposase